MNRHLPYIFSVLKLPLALTVLAWLIFSGKATDLAASAEALADRGSFIPFVAMWFFLVMGLMVIIFPLNLLEEHLLRIQEGDEEEMPARQWLIEFTWELGIRLGIGLMISAAMLHLDAWWWITLSVLWVFYHAFNPLIQNAYLKAADEEDDQRQSPALPEVRKDLEDHGIRIDQIVLIDDEDMAHVTPDIYFVTRKDQHFMYVPQSWARDWTQPELLAACLHKSWMSRPVMQAREIALNALVAVIALGGYALVDRHLRAMTGVSAMTEPAAIPGIIAWISLAASLLKTGGLFFVRRWILSADDAVVKQMRSVDGMIAALKRAKDEGGKPPPPWVEALFSHAPSLEHRLARLER